MTANVVTADQLVVHAIGDYVLQSDWMANNKTKAHFPALCHAIVYSLPFWIFQPSLLAWLVIFGTHFLIDRYRLARYVVWAKNWLSPRVWWFASNKGTVEQKTDIEADAFMSVYGAVPTNKHNWRVSLPLDNWIDISKRATPSFAACSGTGYPPDRPAWLAVWLLIACDNIIHVCINSAALRFL